MEIVTSVRDMKARSRAWRKQGLSVGLVPTMGFLHPGHGSLVERSVLENSRTVVSIFVNPTQFGPGEDLESYPRDRDRDAAYMKSLCANVLFMPEPGEMYPPGFATYVEAPELGLRLCGASRPGHFRGVCTVVLKLLNAASPDRAYFGLKDAQQFFILRRMARDLDLDTSMVPCETVREEDGLAMSSRNSYLTPEERAVAPLLRKGLLAAEAYFRDGGREALKACAVVSETLAAEPRFSLDYAEAVAACDLRPVSRVSSETLLACAARLGRARLIDNIIFDPSGPSRKGRGGRPC
ncbi:MAG: pantoate--beta-alanine ligase [Deltaproteobacteria bacterium]|jgi:pantoate--beta-alanine ligase|nr:pantoate--beta-alanine ligase [Deltaproteobacteria bacterium]